MQNPPRESYPLQYVIKRNGEAIEVRSLHVRAAIQLGVASAKVVAPSCYHNPTTPLTNAQRELMEETVLSA